MKLKIGIGGLAKHKFWTWAIALNGVGNLVRELAARVLPAIKGTEIQSQICGHPPFCPAEGQAEADNI